jgi:hypothetical protein
VHESGWPIVLRCRNWVYDRERQKVVRFLMAWGEPGYSTVVRAALTMSTIVAELYDALRTAGVPEDQARAAAAAVIGVSTQNGYATKADLAAIRGEITELRAQVMGKIAELRMEVRGEIRRLTGEIEQMRAVMATKAELAALEARLVRWNVATIIAMSAVTAAIVKLL